MTILIDKAVQFLQKQGTTLFTVYPSRAFDMDPSELFENTSAWTSQCSAEALIPPN